MSCEPSEREGVPVLVDPAAGGTGVVVSWLCGVPKAPRCVSPRFVPGGRSGSSSPVWVLWFDDVRLPGLCRESDDDVPCGLHPWVLSLSRLLLLPEESCGEFGSWLVVVSLLWRELGESVVSVEGDVPRPRVALSSDVIDSVSTADVDGVVMGEAGSGADDFHTPTPMVHATTNPTPTKVYIGKRPWEGGVLS